MISTPLCLYDCDVPADGSTAVIVSRRDAAAGLRRPPVAHRSRRRRAARAPRRGTSGTTSPRWRAATPRTQMWERTDLAPGRRRHRRAVRRVQLPDAAAGSRRSGSAARARAGRSSKAASGSRLDGELPAQHPRRPAVGAAGCTGRVPPRGVRPAVAGGRRPAGRQGRRGRGARRPAGPHRRLSARQSACVTVAAPLPNERTWITSIICPCGRVSRNTNASAIHDASMPGPATRVR